MAFRPSPHQYFRIFFKHSGKCLDVMTPHRGQALEQARPQKNRDSQLFRIYYDAPIGSPRHYVIQNKFSGHFVDVFEEKLDVGATVGQWEPSITHRNEHFAFLHDGNGYYRIQARHSGLFLCARDASQNDGPVVVQGPGPGDHYLFRFAPAEYLEPASTANLISDSSAQMRELIINVAKKAPKVGGGLAALLGILWPMEDKEHRLWKQMKLYVNELVRELISQERLINLDNRLSGLRKNLEDYNTEAVGSHSRMGAFSGLLTSLNEAEPFFFDERDPEKQLPYFVALGTIHLAVLRERYLDYETIFGEPDARKAEHLKTLQDKIEEYRNAESVSREKATIWRLAHITMSHETRGGLTTRADYWTVRDSYDGYVREINSREGGSLAAAEKIMAERQAEVRSQFGADLDIHLAPARLWRYLDPQVTATPARVTKEVQTGPVAGLKKYPEFADDPHDRPITKIVIHAGTKIDGIEFFYGGVSGGLHGHVGGYRLDYDLADDEFIVDATGSGGEAIDSLFFETNKGRILGGGGKGGANWASAPGDHLGARLYKIFGRAGTGHIESLGFIWRYSLEE